MNKLDLQLLADRRARFARMKAQVDIQARYYNDLAESAALLGDADRAVELDSKELSYSKESAYYDSIIDALDIIIESLKQGYKGIAQYNSIMRNYNNQFDLIVTEGA